MGEFVVNKKSIRPYRPHLAFRKLIAVGVVIAAAALFIRVAVQADTNALSPQTVAYAVSGTNLISFNPLAPGSTTTRAISGIAAGETLAALDFRPQNGFLYALGVNPAADTATLYAISVRNGTAAVVGSPGSISFTTNGVTPVDLPDPATVGYDIDFNPAVDRIRVVAGGLNFRLNPNTGAAVDGDFGGAATAGVNPDGAINGGTSTIGGTAYTNNQPNNGNVTTLYTLDPTTDSLFIQNNPNAGTQGSGQVVTLNGSPIDFTSVGGFDILSGVNAAANNTAAAGTGLAALRVNGTNGIYSINLANGQATFIGNIGSGSLPVSGLTFQDDLGGFPVVALAGSTLQRFSTSAPGTITSVATSGIAAGEQIVGIDYRPQTGQLYGLGINPTTNSARLYLIDPQTGTFTPVGSVGGIAFTTAGGLPVQFADPTTGGYGFDFNPAVDRIRVVSSDGSSFRIDPNTGNAVDGDLGGASGSVAGTNLDGPVNGVGITGLTGVAYTNSFGQSLPGGPTTLYTLDDVSNRISIQNPPNSGTQTSSSFLTLNGQPVDFTRASGFDIPGSVAVAANNAAATGFGYAALTVGTVTGLYQIDLANGTTTFLGPIGNGSSGLTGFAIGDRADGVVVPTPTPTPQRVVSIQNVSLQEGNSGVTVFAFDVTLSLEPPPPGSSVQVDYTTVSGTATAGSDFTSTSGTLTFTSETQNLQRILVNVIGDTDFEPNETFSVALSNLRTTGSATAAFNDTTAVGTIFNDDPAGSGTATPTPTPTATPTPVASPTPARPEGDVVDGSGGPAGDGLVLSNDVTAVRNFVLGTAQPATPSQFQRADVNLVNNIPCGNGQLEAGDVTVIRQMVLGVISSTSPACGPTAPVAATPTPTPASGTPTPTPVSATPTPTPATREVRTSISFGDVVGAPGQIVTVPVVLEATGAEASMSFTMNFDASALTFVDAALTGDTSSGVHLALNAERSAAGQVGLLADSTSAYAAGRWSVALLRFAINPAADGEHLIRFTNEVAPTSVSDAMGYLITSDYAGGKVVVNRNAAAGVNGRVTNANGQGVRGAVVSLRSADGSVRTVTTGSFGFYTFDGLSIGETYTLSVSSKRFRFASQTVTSAAGIATVDLVGLE